jgi:hypothetical protein
MSHSVRSSDRGEGSTAGGAGKRKVETNAPAARCWCWRKRVSRERKAACSETYRACLLNAERFSGRVPGFKAQLPPYPLPLTEKTRHVDREERNERPDRVIRTLQTTSTSGQAKWMEERGGEGAVRDVSSPSPICRAFGGREVPKVRGCGAAKRRNMRVAPFGVRISDV